MVYPALLAAVGDGAHPAWRASSLGVYRFWRDLGYAVGALLSGGVADALGFAAAIHLVAALTLVSGLVVAGAMTRGDRHGGTPIPTKRRLKRGGERAMKIFTVAMMALVLSSGAVTPASAQYPGEPA